MGDVPWCIRGDMNAWLYNEDEKGGARFGHKPYTLFGDWVTRNGCGCEFSGSLFHMVET